MWGINSKSAEICSSSVIISLSEQHRETNASFYNLAVRLWHAVVDSIKCILLDVSGSFSGGVRYTYCTVMVSWWYSISKC